jgi:hypothetical protein
MGHESTSRFTVRASPDVQHGSLPDLDVIGVIDMRIVDLTRLCETQVVTTQLLKR